MFKFKNVLFFLFALFFILACENTGDKQTLKQIAITLIANYAEGKGPIPTIRNYEDAGIIGVNKRNIDELNAYVETLSAKDINTAQKLNAVVDKMQVSLSSDIFGPVITLHGQNPLTLNKGDTYKKVCATAIDKHDGEVQVYVKGEVNTNKVGTYIVTYSAVDEAGNLSSLKRIIHVINPPTNPAPTQQLYYIYGKINATVPRFDFILTNNNNGDSKHIVSTPNNPVLSFVMPQGLTNGSNYSLSLTNAANFAAFCTFTNNTNTNTGSIVSGNVTVNIVCFFGG